MRATSTISVKAIRETSLALSRACRARSLRNQSSVESPLLSQSNEMHTPPRNEKGALATKSTCSPKTNSSSKKSTHLKRNVKSIHQGSWTNGATRSISSWPLTPSTVPSSSATPRARTTTLKATPSTRTSWRQVSTRSTCANQTSPRARLSPSTGKLHLLKAKPSRVRKMQIKPFKMISRLNTSSVRLKVYWPGD